MNFILKGIILFLIALSTNIACAQDRWKLELRGAANFPTKDLGDIELKTGFGFEGTISYNFISNLGAYAGWGWNQFQTDQSSEVEDPEFEETGYTFGLQYVHPIKESILNVLVRAGGVYNHIEVENNNGANIYDSGHGLGWQIGAGLEYQFAKHWKLTPSIRYHSLPCKIELENTDTDTQLNYVSAGIGISWSF